MGEPSDLGNRGAIQGQPSLSGPNSVQEEHSKVECKGPGAGGSLVVWKLERRGERGGSTDSERTVVGEG